MVVLGRIGWRRKLCSSLWPHCRAKKLPAARAKWLGNWCKVVRFAANLRAPFFLVRGLGKSHRNRFRFLFGGRPAAHQRHDRKRRPILLVVVVERIVPPRAVFFLQRQQPRSQLIEVPAALVGRRAIARSPGPRNSGRSSRNSRPPRKTNCAAPAVCGPDRATDRGQKGDRASGRRLPR